MHRLVFALGLILLAFTWPVDAELPALPTDFEAYMRAHHYGAVRVDSDNRLTNTSLVKVQINGRPCNLVIDTGCTYTLLNESCARRLKLNVRKVDKEWHLLSGLDKGPFGYAAISSFTIGGFEINRQSTIGVLLPKDSLDGCDGVLGLDCLRLNAAVIPVGGTGI